MTANKKVGDFRRGTRLPKGRVVEKMVFRSYGIEVEIRMGKDLTFYATIGDTTYDSKEADELKKRVREVVRDLFTAVWKPMIKIEYDGETQPIQAAKFELEYHRFYYAEIGDRFVQLDWATYEHLKEIGASQTTFAERAHSGYGTKPTDEVKPYICHTGHFRDGSYIEEDIEHVAGSFFRPYSEELWQGLENLRHAIDLANTKISALVSTNEGIARLCSGGQLSLTDGKPKKRGSKKGN